MYQSLVLYPTRHHEVDSELIFTDSHHVRPLNYNRRALLNISHGGNHLNSPKSNTKRLGHSIINMVVRLLSPLSIVEYGEFPNPLGSRFEGDLEIDLPDK